MRRGWLALLMLPCCCGAAAAAPQQGLAAAQQSFAAGRYAEVERLLGGLERHRLGSKDLRAAYDLLGMSQERLNDLDKALGTYQLGVALFPKDLNLLTHLADLLHRVGLDDRARPFYERVLNIHPNNAAAHQGLAEIDRASGLLEPAQAHYEKALEERAENPSLWRDLSEIRARRGDNQGAVAAAEKSLALAFSVDTLLVLARTHYAAGRRPEAYASLLRAQGAAPERLELGLQHALWLLDSNDLEGARKVAEGLLRAQPEHPLALWIRGRAALGEGELSKAIADFEKAAEQTEHPFVAAVARSMIRTLRP